MKILLKQLHQGNTIVFPQTSAESVLVKAPGRILTLDKVLSSKIDTIETQEDSSLSAIREGTKVILSHSNPDVVANDFPQPLLIQHDKKGHIVNKSQMGTVTINVSGKPITESYGPNNKNLTFADDFAIDGDNINLRWNNI